MLGRVGNFYIQGGYQWVGMLVYYKGRSYNGGALGGRATALGGGAGAGAGCRGVSSGSEWASGMCRGWRGNSSGMGYVSGMWVELEEVVGVGGVGEGVFITTGNMED